MNISEKKDHLKSAIVHLSSRFRVFDVIVAAAAIIVGILCGCLNLAPDIEQSVLSGNILAAARPASSEQPIVVVMCTDNTIERLAPDTGWPIDRSHYTQLLTGPLAGADTVVFDILFADSIDEQTDTDFAQAIAQHGSVVLARSESTLPAEPLFYSGARIGYAVEFSENNRDAVSRSYKLYVNRDLRTGPTLICSVLLNQGYTVEYDGRGAYAVGAPDGETIRLNVDDNGFFYRIPLQHGTDVLVIDLYDVLTGNYAPGTFDDAVVFIGGTVAGFEDIVYAPDFPVGEDYTHGSAAMRVVGTKFLADSYQTVLSGFSPRRTSAAAEGVICCLIFLLTAFFSLRTPAKYNWSIPLAVCGGWFALCRLLFTTGALSLPFGEPAMCGVAAFLAAVAARLVRTSRERLVSSLPIETLYRIAYELDDIDSSVGFEEYILGFEDSVFEQLGAKILFPATPLPENLSAVEKAGRNSGTILLRNAAAEQYGVRALIIIPLPSFGDEDQEHTILGANRRTPTHWVQSVTAMVLAMYVYHKAHTQSSMIQHSALSMMDMIIQMIDAKDPVTAGHSRRVSDYSRQIAEWLGFDRRKVSDVAFAALLHDIGKIGVADNVLNKPGLFTDDDFAQMRSHPAVGADIVRTIGMSEDIIDGVLHHHGRIDGRGYPDDSSGGEYARIIKVADVYDALTSQRQYKSAWDTVRALDVIHKGIGTEFDERIARTFIENTAPEDYCPGDSSRHNDSGTISTKRLTDFARDLWSRSKDPLTEKQFAAASSSRRFSFDCARGFAGLQWGERFSSPDVLRSAPEILHYDHITDGVVTALAGAEGDMIHSTVYYFHKQCLSAGCAAVPGPMVTKAEAALTKIHGKPSGANGCLVWRGRSYSVVKIHSDGLSAFVFITDYLANEI